MRNVPMERTDETPHAVAEYAEATRRRYETARLIATRRYWRGTRVRTPFVPPDEDTLAVSR